MMDLTPEEARRLVRVDPNLQRVKEMIVSYLEGLYEFIGKQYAYVNNKIT